jgi:hypothetical protein
MSVFIFTLFLCVSVHAMVGVDWTAATRNAAFPSRNLNAVLSYNNYMWVIAGVNASAVHMNDVWYSSNGADWNLATGNANFCIRAGVQGLVYNNEMWVISGNSSGLYLNDAWHSTDGVNWAAATSNAQFSPRDQYGSAVFDNGTGPKMWVMAGYNTAGATYFKDVWYSSNGADWYAATQNAAFGGRLALKCAVYNPGSGDRLWVVGGYTYTGVSANDVWWSTNGADWNLATGNAGFSPREGMGFEVYDNRMWVIGGKNGSTIYSDVWYSYDGVTWTCANPTAAFGNECEGGTTVFDNKMWSIDGMTCCGREAWYTEVLPTSTNTPTLTITGTETGTATITPTSSGTGTQTQSATPTSTRTKTGTATITPTPSYTGTEMQSVTPTLTVTVTQIPTRTVTQTLTRTVTQTPTITMTPTPYPTGELVVYPNPYNCDTAFKGTLKFLYVKPGSNVIIYTLSGELVASRRSDTNLIEWDGRNPFGERTSPGVYLYMLEEPDKGKIICGKVFKIK